MNRFKINFYLVSLLLWVLEFLGLAFSEAQGPVLQKGTLPYQSPLISHLPLFQKNSEPWSLLQQLSSSSPNSSQVLC